MPARDKEAGAEGWPPDGSPAEPEFLPLTAADLTLGADPKQPCPDCGQPMAWTVGRTVLLCACSGRFTFHLPVAVGTHYGTIKQQKARAERATAAVNPDPDEQLRKLQNESEREDQNEQLRIAVDDVIAWAVWMVGTPLQAGDAEFLRVTRKRLMPLRDKADGAATHAVLDTIRRALTAEARRVADRWGHFAYPGLGCWGPDHGYVQTSALPTRQPPATPADQPADDVIDVESWVNSPNGSPVDLIGVVVRGLANMPGARNMRSEPRPAPGPVPRRDGLCSADWPWGGRCTVAATSNGGMVYCDSHAHLWNGTRTNV